MYGIFFQRNIRFARTLIENYKSNKYRRQVTTFNSNVNENTNVLFNLNVSFTSSIESDIDYKLKITSNSMLKNKSFNYRSSLLNSAIELLVVDSTKKTIIANSTVTTLIPNNANLNIYANINEHFYSWFRVLSYVAFSLVIFSSISIIAFIFFIFGYRSSTRSRMNLKRSSNSSKN